MEVDYALNRLRISTAGTGEVVGKTRARREIIAWHKDEATKILDRLYQANDHLDPMKIITAIDAERASLRKIK